MTRQNTRADYVRKAEIALDEARNLDPNLAPHPEFEIAAIVGAATVYAALAALPLCPRKIRQAQHPAVCAVWDREDNARGCDCWQPCTDIAGHEGACTP